MDPVSIALGVGGIASNIFANSQNQRNYENNLAFQKYTYNDSKIYNSVVNQVRQMRAAGMNPAFLFGGQAGQSSAMAAPSAPSQVPLDMNGLVNLSGSILNNQANQSKTESEVQLNKLHAYKQDWDNFVARLFAVDEHSAALKKLGEDTKVAVNQANLLAAQGKYTEALEQLAHAQEFLAYAQGGKSHQEMLNLQEEGNWIIETNKAYINYLRSGSALNSSNARLNNQLGDAQDKYKEEYQATVQEAYYGLVQRNDLTSNQSKVVKEMFKQYEKTNNVFYLTLAADYLLKFAQTGLEAIGLKKKLNLLQQQVNNQSQDFEDVDIENTTQFDDKGNLVTTKKQRSRRRKHRP